MFASMSSGPVRALGTANSGSGMPPFPLLTPRIPPFCVLIVFTVAITIRIRKAIPTKVE